MYYTVYKITNVINNKIYIGCHKTEDLDDGYMGSGKYLKNAIKKYGIENFVKEILDIFSSPEDMFISESFLVNEEFVKRNDTYNLKKGGEGGWDWINRERSPDELEERKKILRESAISSNKKIRERLDNDIEFRNSFILSSIKNISNAHRDGKVKYGCFEGRKHSENSKKIIGEKNKLNSLGNKNSQYGTMWINNPILNISKKIKKDEKIPEGWIKGRKIK